MKKIFFLLAMALTLNFLFLGQNQAEMTELLIGKWINPEGEIIEFSIIDNDVILQNGSTGKFNLQFRGDVESAQQRYWMITIKTNNPEGKPIEIYYKINFENRDRVILTKIKGDGSFAKDVAYTRQLE